MTKDELNGNFGGVTMPTTPGVAPPESAMKAIVRPRVVTFRYRFFLRTSNWVKVNVLVMVDKSEDVAAMKGKVRKVLAGLMQEPRSRANPRKGDEVSIITLGTATIDMSMVDFFDLC